MLVFLWERECPFKNIIYLIPNHACYSHKSMATLFRPFINRTAMTSRLSNPFLLVYASAASLYTDGVLS